MYFLSFSLGNLAKCLLILLMFSESQLSVFIRSLSLLTEFDLQKCAALILFSWKRSLGCFVFLFCFLVCLVLLCWKVDVIPWVRRKQVLGNLEVKEREGFCSPVMKSQSLVSLPPCTVGVHLVLDLGSRSLAGGSEKWCFCCFSLHPISTQLWFVPLLVMSTLVMIQVAYACYFFFPSLIINILWDIIKCGLRVLFA